MQIEATYLVPLSSLSENLWYYSQIEITPLKCLKMTFRTEFHVSMDDFYDQSFKKYIFVKLS